MLERIHRIKGIGLLHDADGRAQRLQKATFIYADNGRGKSTLASLFRSCSTNNPALLLNRRTIDGNQNPEATLQFSNGQRAVFQNGNWNIGRPELLVFDADFVEQNVYAGGKVTPDQRKNLLQFALGESAVVAQREYDHADNAVQATSNAVRETVSQLSLIHQGVTLAQFQQIAEVPNADEQILALNAKIVEARNIELIQAKAQPQQLPLPTLDIEPIFRVLATSLNNIDLAAEQRVRNHLSNHNKDRLEKWISDGYAYGEEENCLFCNQSLEGVDLIQAYRSYFNQDYNQLKSNVAQLSALVDAACDNEIINRLRARFETASAVVDGWQEHVDVSPPVFDESSARNALSNIKAMLENLKNRKEVNLLDEVGTEEDKDLIDRQWKTITDVITACNETIENASEQISQYKAGLTALNVEDMQQQIRDLELAKTRHRQDVIALLAQLEEQRNQDADAKREKQLKKDTLNRIMQLTLESYKDRINELLRGFGAQFLIPNIDFNYRGGLRSDYALQMRGGNIALNGGVPDFKTSLSEGDKRTLAFAFFIASAESDPDISNKIIVIDDPMCSLDLNRKQQTRTVLKRLHDNCEQIIVLAHDVHFLRNLRDDVLRTENPNNVKCFKLKAVANRYSDFDEINVDQECEGAYFRSHRVLDEYMAGNAQSSMEIARSIRPMLEGYLHRRFPGMITSGLLFGQIIDQINNAQPPSPLVHAQNITTELNEINRYAGQFHHDTNPAADQVQIVDGELLNFAERAIKIVHAGVA
ncbi:AAA family ATPase [Microbulbifer sp. YPW16]|uniref:AAA family ATPase n=1 Tax=Microbulbifer sp. YPW16 TaxID=2904242 RepID=UPI001E63BC11|nr:AAA family ATPase [Microbulbifer sp. YPW16]UHQ55802.1 AAA family ATPase [Microbulbifer sp. YPW16]